MGIVQERTTCAVHVHSSASRFRLVDLRVPELAPVPASVASICEVARPPLREALLKMILRNEDARKMGRGR